MKKTTITVTSETHTRLKQNATWGETMDTIINRLLDCIEGVNKK